MCRNIMESIGRNKPVIAPIPKKWREELIKNNIKCSNFGCNFQLFLLSLKRLSIGFIKSNLLFNKRYTLNNVKSAYVVFMELNENFLKSNGEGEKYDIISWYKKSNLNKSNIKGICVQVDMIRKTEKNKDLNISRGFLASYDNFFSYVIFFLKNVYAFIISLLGILTGKWWLGILYEESIYLNYLTFLNKKLYAKEYFFRNTRWFHKPLWCYHVESFGSYVSLYNSSCNMIKFFRPEIKEPDTYGLKTMSWNRYIVWDKYQEEFYKKYSPKSEFIQSGYINIGGVPFNLNLKKNKKVLAIFDVTPSRTFHHCNHGFALPTSIPKWSLDFFGDIISVFDAKEWSIIWKKKRNVPHYFTSKIFLRDRDKITKNIINLDFDIAAASIIKKSDAVICMPFTSPTIIAKIENIPSIFYNTTNFKKYKKVHGVQVLYNKIDLLNWSKKI